jgi:hypothetical protein
MSSSTKRVRPHRKVTIDEAVWKAAEKSLYDVYVKWDDVMMPGSARGRNRKQAGALPSMSELIEVLLEDFSRVAALRIPPPQRSLGGRLFCRSKLSDPVA